MKLMTLLSALLISINAFAAKKNMSEQWCVWDGEDYIHSAVKNGDTWAGAVYNLLVNGSDVKSDFEGLGSCRFIPSSSGADLKEAMGNFQKAYPIATTAYLKVTMNGTTPDMKLVVPSATFGAGTTLVTFNKDFYSMDKATCETQKQEVLEIGRQSAGLQGLDTQMKDNKNGGIAVAITPSTTTTRFYGICNFHPLN